MATPTAPLSPSAIVAALDVRAVLDAHGIDHDGAGELRLTECPVCGHHAARGVAQVNLDSGLWRCFKCRETGNAYALLAALDRLDLKRDREKLLARATALVGEVTPERVAKRKAEAAQHRAERERRRAVAIGQMPARWAALPSRHAGGEAYLRENRGLNPLEHPLLGSVRYRDTRLGDPALPLVDLKTGTIVGIQSRRTLPDEPKFHTDRYSQTSGAALYGRLTDLDEGRDVAVLVEGLIDTMTALVAFPTCAVFGAHNAGELATIAAALAPRVRELRGWLLIVAHDDKPDERGREAGVDNAVAAAKAGQAAGLEYAPIDAGDVTPSVRFVDLGQHQDLNDAWRAGWRWSR